MKYKGIIFDLDGVICSTDEYHYQASDTLMEMSIQVRENESAKYWLSVLNELRNRT